MHKIDHQVGRLVEITVASPVDAAEVQEFVREFMAVVARIPGKYVGIVDLLGAYVFPPAIAEGLIQLLSSSSPRVERTALLIGDSEILALQAERALRAANSEDHRRVFRRPEELEAWLGEALTIPELARLKLVLAARQAQ